MKFEIRSVHIDGELVHALVNLVIEQIKLKKHIYENPCSPPCYSLLSFRKRMK